MTKWDVMQIVLVVAAVIATPIVLRLRRRSHQRFLDDFADQEICDHLRPAFVALKQRGHQVVRAGQRTPQLPLEIHMSPPFDPKALAAELGLAEPVFVSERNVLGCREDECEIRPVS